MTLGDLVGLVAKPGDRSELLELGRNWHRARRERDAAAGHELLERIMERIQWHFRAIRAPMPSREDVERMIADHFGAREP
jgi:hypothetical protein